MTDEQALTLARLMRDFNATGVTLNLNWFDLPDGYAHVQLVAAGERPFEAGIAPNGDASS